MLSSHDIPGLDDLASPDFAAGKAEPQFALAATRYHVHKAKAQDKKQRRGIKKFILADNARPILACLPNGPDDRTHVTVRGDFVLCDLIPLIIAQQGHCPHLRIATLGLSAANATTLAHLHAHGHVAQITLIASHYFQQVDKDSTYRQVSAILLHRARIAIARCHAKVILIPSTSGEHLIIEGSANLRSSDNIEQLVILNDIATHDHHAQWMDTLAHHGS